MENSPKVSRFYASKNHLVDIELGRQVTISMKGANGRVTDEQTYPIGRELIVRGNELCDAELVRGRPGEIVTRTAFQSVGAQGTQIVFLQAVRKRKVGADLPVPPSTLLEKIKNRLMRVALPGFLEMYYANPDEFIHGVITLDPKGDVADFRVNVINDPQQYLGMTAEDLRSPDAFIGTDNELRAHRAFRYNPEGRIQVNDVLYNEEIKTRYRTPVRRPGPVRNHTTSHLLPPSRPPEQSLPRRANRSPSNGRVAAMLRDGDRTQYQNEVRDRVNRRVEEKAPQ